VLHSKGGLHIVMMYLVLGKWPMPWSFGISRGKGHPTMVKLGCKLLTIVPTQLSQRRTILVLCDTEFGTVDFLPASRPAMAIDSNCGNAPMLYPRLREAFELGTYALNK
jgi:hypothetical protein